MKARRKCPQCRHPEAECGSATDGRPSYRCTKCSFLWTEGLTVKQRKVRAAGPALPDGGQKNG